MRISIDKTRVARVRKLVQKLSNGTVSGLWERLKVWLTNIKEMMFKKRGGSYDRPKWQPISPTLFGKIRRGSDGNRHGTYSAGSQPLQASGLYRSSFKFKESPKYLRYYSNSRIADKIMYGGWNKKIGRFDPRYALPDTNSRQFAKELHQHLKITIKNWLKEVK